MKSLFYNVTIICALCEKKLAELTISSDLHSGQQSIDTLNRIVKKIEGDGHRAYSQVDVNTHAQSLVCFCDDECVNEYKKINKIKNGEKM